MHGLPSPTTVWPSPSLVMRTPFSSALGHRHAALVGRGRVAGGRDHEDRRRAGRGDGSSGTGGTGQSTQRM